MSWEVKRGSYTVRVFSACYMDWGLEITKDSLSGVETCFYNPCWISNESCGAHTEDEDGRALDEGQHWTDAEWIEWVDEEADRFLEECVGVES